jgi:hypothetical protein
MLDGRHTGTGGGNHITLGGSDAGRLALPAPAGPADEPDHLLANHPALSYLFSGMFIGPTSQAPRVDEARHESLYELEIAFQQMAAGSSPAKKACSPGWSTACCATCWSISRATRTAPSSASTSCIRPTAPPDASAWSNSAASRCRRTRR